MTAAAADVESHLVGLEISAERASYGSVTAPHRLLAEARTAGTPGYVDVACDGAYCEPSCSACYGTPLTAQDGATLGGIDFRLVAGATLGGSVTSSVDGSPIADVEIWLRRFGSNSTLAQATTGADGTYTIPELPPGQFRVLASSAQWADEVFDNVPREPSCGAMAGTPVFLSTGQNAGGVDFALDRTGSISGHAYLSSNDDGIASSIHLHNALGLWITSTYSNPSEASAYSFGDLPAGTYFAAAETWGWRELYCELPWPDPLDATEGTPITVAGGHDTPSEGRNGRPSSGFHRE